MEVKGFFGFDHRTECWGRPAKNAAYAIAWGLLIKNKVDLS